MPTTITAVLTNPVQYTPGMPDVMIPYTIVAPEQFKSQHLEAVRTTQDVLAAGNDTGNWGDEPCRSAVQRKLADTFGVFDGVTIEVLLADEWAERQAADAKAKAAADADASNL